jgi:galactitol-specific phosphotransferase system IIC component
MVIKMKIIEGVKFGIKLYIGYIGMETLVYMMSNPKKVCDKFSKRAKHVKH